MVRNCKIEILRPSQQREAGETVGEPTLYRTLWADKTVDVGNMSSYASRWVHENEAVYSIRWTRGLEQSMMVKDGDVVRPIISIHEEGYRRLQHIKITLSDAAYETEN